jgi:alkanesulfonate monooxygenase SsuD/methylene tetrahydromethanopterin reductase-like flavin-dependent oxidoreductase (luciferase family)
MKIGAALPTLTDSPAQGRAKNIVRFAERAEELGFSSLWAEDHLLRMNPSPTYSGLAWLDPLQCLAMVAPHTTIPLGTVYCACLRHPVLLTKEIATLMHLCNERLIIAPVLGWWDKEHNTAGFPKSERAGRTDEWLDVLRLLLSTQGASYEGRFHSFEDISIDPLPSKLPTIWATGGGANYDGAVQDQASLKPGVINRILGSDGWMVSAQSSGKKTALDLELLSDAAAARGQDMKSLYMSHVNFVHVVETNDREKAYEVQAPLWNQRRTIKGEFEYMSETSYMTGSIDDIIGKLELRAKAYGLQEFVAFAHPGHEEAQLELWAKHLLPAIAGF